MNYIHCDIVVLALGMKFLKITDDLVRSNRQIPSARFNLSYSHERAVNILNIFSIEQTTQS